MRCETREEESRLPRGCWESMAQGGWEREPGSHSLSGAELTQQSRYSGAQSTGFFSHIAFLELISDDRICKRSLEFGGGRQGGAQGFSDCRPFVLGAQLFPHQPVLPMFCAGHPSPASGHLCAHSPHPAEDRLTGRGATCMPAPAHPWPVPTAASWGQLLSSPCPEFPGSSAHVGVGQLPMWGQGPRVRCRLSSRARVEPHVATGDLSREARLLLTGLRS